MAKKRDVMSSDDKQVVWHGWHGGRTMSDIAREIGKAPASVFGLLRQYGGIEPTPRTRNARCLSLEEREEISRGLATGASLRAIGAGLGRSPSTISREITRNGGAGRYRACNADANAWVKARRPKRCVLSQRPTLCKVVADKLEERWSPQQISRWLGREHAENETMSVSHETIYKSLYIQSRGVLKKELQNQLRRRRRLRHSRAGNRGGARGLIIDAEPICDRPDAVEDRAVPGHWEGDLITGSANTHIATLVERQTRFLLLVQIDGKDTKSVVDALIRQMNQLPELVLKTLTWDRGTELADHDRFSVATDIDVYFCDPGSPWQRGSNENTNGLLRQYFPKGTSLGGYTQSQLNAVARELNCRPRKTLGYKTPIECFNEVLR